MVSVSLYVVAFQAPAFQNSHRVTLCFFPIADLCYAVHTSNVHLPKSSNLPPAFVKTFFILVQNSLGGRISDGQKKRWSIRGPALRSLAEEEETASGACITTHKKCKNSICDDAMPHTRISSCIGASLAEGIIACARMLQQARCLTTAAAYL